MSAPTLVLIADTPAAADGFHAFLRGRFPEDRLQIARLDTAATLQLLDACPAQDMPRVILVARDGRFDRTADDVRRIRAHARGRLVPVVLLQGQATPDDIGEAARLGANSCVREVADAERRAHDLDQIVRYWIDLNIPPPCVPQAAA